MASIFISKKNSIANNVMCEHFAIQDMFKNI